MPNDPWERIADLAEQIKRFAEQKMGVQIIESMATEVMMQCVNIREWEVGSIVQPKP